MINQSTMLDIQGVNLSYRSRTTSFAKTATAVHVLDNVSFRLNAGEQVAIIGPNGAGKSSLLKLIAGILKPDQGQIQLQPTAVGQELCIAYVPQRNEIDWRFPVTVADVVMMGRTQKIGLFRRPTAQDHAIVRASLARVQAESLANVQIGQLSGGQQQRIFIARALALETELLLMDEPLAGLDVPSQEATLQILDSLRQDGVTVLLATHDLAFAAERFDQVMLLNKKIVAFGPATAVMSTDNLLAAYGGKIYFSPNPPTQYEVQ